MDERPFPTAAIAGAGLLMLTTLLGVGAVQLDKHFHPLPASAIALQPVQTRELRFVDRGDGVNAFAGHVRVFDARTGQELPQLRDNDGFVRAVLNALYYERTRRDVSAPPVFELAQWPDHTVTLRDTATGAKINVGSFGIGNKTVFLRFFTSTTS